MTKTFITDEGKRKLLKLGFLGETNCFKYMALSNGNAAVTQDKTGFNEVINRGNYTRVQIQSDEVAGLADNNRSICITGVFEGSNYNLSDGGLITEIAIVDTESHNDAETFFAFIQVPEIIKTDNITLKYSVIISLL